MQYERTLQEVITLAQLEPSIKDIYVEGSSDRQVLKWYNSRINEKLAIVKTIDSIHITDDEVKKYGFANAKNNKAKIITLAKALEEYDNGINCILCIADKDLDHFRNRLVYGSNIIYYDWTSLEMVFFNSSCMDKFITLAYPKIGMPGKELLTAMTPVLKSVYAIRIVMDEESIQTKLLWRRLLALEEDNQISFDITDAVKRTINKVGRARDRDYILSKCKDINFDCDDRDCIRGHDFTDLLTWITSKYYKEINKDDREIIEKIIISSIEVDLLATGAPSFFNAYNLWLNNHN